MFDTTNMTMVGSKARFSIKSKKDYLYNFIKMYDSDAKKKEKKKHKYTQI